MDSPPLVSIKLDLDGCALGNPYQLGIEAVVRNHHKMVLRVFSKLAGVGLACEADNFNCSGGAYFLLELWIFLIFLVERDLAIMILGHTIFFF